MTTRSTTGQIDFNHWLVRLIAYIIDAVIIFIVTTILGIIIAIIAIAAIATGSVLFYGGLWITFGLFGLLSILYFIILDVAGAEPSAKEPWAYKFRLQKAAKYQLANHSYAT